MPHFSSLRRNARLYWLCTAYYLFANTVCMQQSAVQCNGRLQPVSWSGPASICCSANGKQSCAGSQMMAFLMPSQDQHAVGARVSCDEPSGVL